MPGLARRRLNATATVTADEPARPPSAATAPSVADNVARPSPMANAAPSAAAAPTKPAAVPPANVPASGEASDERRADRCLRFAEGKSSQFGDATLTNTCSFAIEVALCYKGGGGGVYDCPSRPKGMRMDSVSPGATRNLPEYRRDRHKGIASVACKGTLGTVIPLLNGEGGKTGCY